MANDIAEKQNSPECLEHLAASSQLYSYGKFALTIQVTLTVGFAILLAIYTRFNQEFKVWATFVAVTITWLDVLVFDRVQIFFRKRGALIQEALDCGLFGLEWNELRCGKPLEREAVHSAAETYLATHQDAKIRDWYPTVVGQLDLPFARIICQRACLWWDTTQRKFYGICLMGLGALICVLVLALGVSKHMIMDDLILGVYAPIAPAIIWCFREARRQRDAADSLEKARGVVEGIWKQITTGKLKGKELEVTSRRIQDTLFENRNKNPLIFNWIYSRLRTGQESAMRKAATGMVEEIKALQM